MLGICLESNSFQNTVYNEPVLRRVEVSEVSARTEYQLSGEFWFKPNLLVFPHYHILNRLMKSNFFITLASWKVASSWGFFKKMVGMKSANQAAMRYCNIQQEMDLFLFLFVELRR